MPSDEVAQSKQLAMGIDASLNRGLDVVVMAAGRAIRWARGGVEPEEVEALLRKWQPGVVAIDSPPGPGCEPGRPTRECEQRLRALGINIFSTPSDADRYQRPFYDWIREGEETFKAAARAGYLRQEYADDIEHRALEVFPHASDVFLRGCLPPARIRRRIALKRAWRLETLRLVGVDPSGLCVNIQGNPTLDSIDAALAALTGIRAVEGDYTAYGIASEWIIVPGSTPGPFRRCDDGPDA